MTPDLLLPLVAVAATILCLWALAPPIAALVGWSSTRTVVAGNAADLSAERSRPEFAGIHAQLERAGFRPLALLRETIRLDGAFWWKHIPEQLFVDRDAVTSAMLYSIFGETTKVVLTTEFDDGLTIDTAAQSPELDEDSPEYVRRTIETTDLTVLLAEHRSAVFDHLATGARTLPADDLERCASGERGPGPANFAHIAKARLGTFALSAFTTCGMTGLYLGTKPLAIWLSIAGAALIDRVFLQISVAMLVRQTRQARRDVQW